MKKLALASALTLLLSFPVFAQDQKDIVAPEAIIGEWKVANANTEAKFESIIFYASGLLNIDAEGSKLVVNYKVSKSDEGYEVFVGGMEHTSHFSSFIIKTVDESHMLLTVKAVTGSKTLPLIKARNIPHGVFSLEVSK